MRLLAAAVLVALIAVVLVAVTSGGSASVRTSSQFVAATPEAGAPVQLDTTLYLPSKTPAPAILLAHGFGGSKTDLDTEARSLARGGYVVLAYSARGFGQSGGLIHLDAPDYEIADGSKLISYLATLPEVTLDSPGDPRVGVAGSSYGGGLALMLAGLDKRVDAVGADITWNDLQQALFPNASGGEPGVFKKQWAGELFSSTLAPGEGACGRFAADLCAVYQRAASTGEPDAQILSLLAASSPKSVLNNITAPTLLSQGEQDSLFPLGQADANARGIAANGTPVKVIWRDGGHDGGTSTSELTSDLRGWFDPILRKDRTPSRSFEISIPSAGLSAANGRTVTGTLRVDAGYPGAGGPATPTQTFGFIGPTQQIQAPPGGFPAAVTTVPGLGSLLGVAGSVGATSSLAGVPGQVALFASQPLPRRTLIAGSSTVRLRVSATGSDDATLFVSLHDVAADGTDALPSNLVSPVRVTGLSGGVAKTVTVTLPGIVRQVASGHRLVVEVSTTDLAYALPQDPRSYTISLASAAVTVPIENGQILRTGHPLAWLLVGIAVSLLVVLAWTLHSLRRRSRRVTDASLVNVPVAVEGLVKEYGDGYRAVDDATFRVERGQVVGLLGPNGAGKTTALRVLMGLIRPTKGSVRIFGELIEPGAPVLSRVGAFIEGPGLLPHLSGRDNLRLFWAATGRPEADADFETALEIAGLGASVERRVKTYSHGMKQRLAIAQAMLGLPELLVLDEPTNGLDPPQIAEMREVLRRYAATGRTVVVSSHLLAEVEQTCTHVVVMHKGRLVAAGSVTEIAGEGGMQLAVADAERAAEVLSAAGIASHAVPSRRALEDVFLEMVGGDQQ
jgi:ABC-2 type transport system ATP-binding protein